MRFLTAIILAVLSLPSQAQVGTDKEALIEGLKARIAAEGCDIPDQLTALIGLSPDQVVSAAKILGDLRYFGIANPSIEVPGVSYSFALCPATERHIQLFDVDADPFRCPTYAELVKSLSTFATLYNALILEERKNGGIETCTI